MNRKQGITVLVAGMTAVSVLGMCLADRGRLAQDAPETAAGSLHASDPDTKLEGTNSLGKYLTNAASTSDALAEAERFQPPSAS